jgi:ADP-ribosylation factor-like protein 5B
MTPAEIAEQLNLQAIKTHSWHIQSCCGLTGEGLYEGIEWVTQAVTKA